jgi:DNA gyrase subunit A
LKEGDSVAAAIVVGSSGRNDEELLISTVGGMLLRIPLKKIPILSRYAKGSCVVKLHQGDEVSAVTVIQKQE